MNKETNVTQLLPEIDTLWEQTKGDASVTIAVLDGPVDLQHDTLREAAISSLDVLVQTEVRSTHGTFVTSLIFASHDSGVLGIAPTCSGLVKSIYREDENGNLLSSSQSDIEYGIREALDQEADIINISGGEKLREGDQIIATLADALDLCEKKGVLVVAATGNEGDDNMHVPASYPTVLAVGSIQKDGLPSTFSNWSKVGAAKGIVAPGEDVVGAIANHTATKAISKGTSFSTALVSGVAGLLASLQKKLGQKKDLLAIRQILMGSVTPCTVDEQIDCAPIMTGRLNIHNAMRQVLEAIPDEALQETSDDVVTSATTAEENTTTTIESQNFLTLNNTNMENQKETTPSLATNDLVDTGSPQVAPSSDDDAITRTAAVQASNVTQSSCGCNNAVSTSGGTTFNPVINPGGYPTYRNSKLVNAIGQPSYDFGTRNNLDTFTALMRTWYRKMPEGVLKGDLTDSPHDHKSMAAFLLYKEDNEFPNAFMASQLIWLLNMNSTPIYSIGPKLSSFRGSIYLILEQFLANNVGIDYVHYTNYTNKLSQGEADEKLYEKVFITGKDDDDLMRMVLPGFVSGESTLINGNVIETVTPVAYGLKNWTLNALVDSLGFEKETPQSTEVMGAGPGSVMPVKKGPREHLISILNRLYVSTLNKGQSPEDRALNYSLYNIVELSEIIKEVAEAGLQLSGYKVVPSKISRQNSISREVQLTFFDPTDTNKASVTYSMQVDVSGVTPIMIGETQKWYAPVRVATI